MRSTIFGLTCFALFCTATVSAQTGPTLLFKPWEPDSRLELSAQATFFNTGETDSGAADEVDLQIYESQGRFRLNDEKASPFAIGYQLYYLNIDTSDAALPERLVDQQIAIGAELFQCDGWAVSLIAGLGFASSLPFADSDAVYARGDIVATKKLDEKSTLQLGLNYDGNRALLPDVPLPGIAYSRKVSETFSYTIGLPFSSIYWVPADRWSLRASISPSLNMDVELGYEVVEKVTLFAAFRNEFRAFHVNEDDENRRVFFEQKLVEAGVRFKLCPTCEIFAVGGFAFDQEFTRGWDVRDTEEVRELSDEPYVRVGGRVRF